jgi:hypothetical protein
MKYSCEKIEENKSYVWHTEVDTKTLIAVTDTLEKAHFLSNAANNFHPDESPSGEGDAVDWWISLKDRLPKHGQKVDLWLGSYRKEWTWEGQDSENIMISGAKATHWMPAPTPPKSPIK